MQSENDPDIFNVFEKENKNDPVNPNHYKVGGISVFKILEKKLSKEEYIGFLKGNIIKYILRGAHKGNETEDYKKAMKYNEELIRFSSKGKS